MPHPLRAVPPPPLSGALTALGLALLVSVAPARAAEVPLPPPRPPASEATIPPTIPLPPERPAELVVPDPQAPAPDQPPAASLLPPHPEPPPRPPEFAGPVATEPPRALDDAEETACRGRLAALGVVFTLHEPIADGECGAPRPITVTALPGGLALAPGAITRCPVAEALARWGEDVRGAAQRHLAAAPTRLVTGGSYECRSRNHVAGAKLSEHGHANAVDVMAFAFAGRRDLPVTGGGEGAEAAFLAEVRAKACAAFTTVLGPGSDPSHANHLHLDLRERRIDYRLCQ